MKPYDVYSIFDIEIARASGSTLWHKNGHAYLDLYGGHAVISIGHSHPDYVAAISDQLNKIGFYSNSVKINLQDELAEKLGMLSGYPDYDLFLCNSGAEANENAFKLASFYNDRKKIIAFGNSFHGRTSLALAATDNPGITAPINNTGNVCFLPLNNSEALEKTMDESVSAIIVEGIQGVAGINTPSPAFLKQIENLCHKYGALMILDEVQSGYGRSGKFFAHQWANVKPHLITVAKGMGNGFPVAGVLISAQLPARKEMLGTTFGGNYLACAAAISVLDVIKKENLVENAMRMGEYLSASLRDVPQIKEIRGSGLMIGVELHEPCTEIRKTLLFRYSIFTGSSSNKNTIRILPSLAITKKEIDVFVDALKLSLTSKNDEVLYHSK
jgi:acetylornithine/N-succinyldiaminopimelate aminotransferase